VLGRGSYAGLSGENAGRRLDRRGVSAEAFSSEVFPQKRFCTARPGYAAPVVVFAISKGGAVALGVLAFVVLIALAGALKPITKSHDKLSDRGDYIGEPPGFRKPPDEGGLL
jgi:hypothetical protein